MKNYAVAVMLSKHEPGKTNMTMTQHLRRAESEGEALASALEAAMKAKPEHSIDMWLVSEIDVWAAANGGEENAE